MRILPSLLIVISLAVFAACHRDEPRTGRNEVPAPSADNGVVNATLLSLERNEDHISVRVRLENISPAAVQVKNFGDTLTGFRVRLDGRDVSAETRRRDTPMMAAALHELPPQVPVEIDLHWQLRPAQPQADYGFVVIIGNLFQGEQKLPEVALVVPQNGHPRRTDAKKSDKSSPGSNVTL